MSCFDPATDYFAPVCRDAFDNFLKANDFQLAEEKSWSLTYRRGLCWFRIHHYPEDSPQFSPMLTVGMHTAPFPWLTRLYCKVGLVRRALDGRPILFNEVGLWCVIPPEAPASAYSEWRFSSRKELEEIAPRLRDEVVALWAPALWDDPQHFEVVLSNRYRDYVEEAKRERCPPDPRQGFAILHDREQEIRRLTATGDKP